uniref:VPS35 endosomal protein-sorting factor-like n=1 Tax=Anolis carolinensis TaxID=28377 RepID=H9G5I8_ANOCA
GTGDSLKERNPGRTSSEAAHLFPTRPEFQWRFVTRPESPLGRWWRGINKVLLLLLLTSRFVPFFQGSQKELLNLTQQDYTHRIEELNQSLKDAWASDQKVKALKIVIQCSKLLSDTTVIQFYPSKFVLITDILDTFGKYVTFSSSFFPENFTPESVNDTAKETCLNWFFKIASIRELIPRFYVEAAILKCNKFLSKTGILECLPRLTSMIRGIGDPLVAVYARAYLCRVGMEVAPHLKESLNKNFFDFLLTFKQIHGDTVQNQLVVQCVEMPLYLTLYSPAIDWILQCISYRAAEVLLTETMERCKKLGNNALLLNSVMSAFRAEFIAARSMDFIGMIKECDESGFPKHLLFRSLGQNLALADPPEGDRLQILNEAWKVITKLKSPQDYINCAEIWVEYTCRHFTKREVNTVLADVIKHMTPDRAFEDAYPQLQSIIQKVITYFHDFSILFSLEKFLPFLDMFQKESVRVEVCKCIMEAFIKHQQEPTRDPVILNALLHVCKTMHDSVKPSRWSHKTIGKQGDLQRPSRWSHKTIGKLGDLQRPSRWVPKLLNRGQSRSFGLLEVRTIVSHQAQTDYKQRHNYVAQMIPLELMPQVPPPSSKELVGSQTYKSIGK